MAGGARINVATQIKDGIITAAKMASGAIVSAAAQLTTTTFTAAESTAIPQANNTIEIKPRTGDVGGALAISPSGDSRIAQIDLVNAADPTDAGVLEIFLSDDEAAIVTTKNGAGTAVSFNIYADLFQWIFSEIDGSITLPGALKFGAGVPGFFNSADVTGNGAPQTTPHFLDRTPQIFIAYMTKANAAGDAITDVSADGTNITATATTGCKYRILAL